MQTILDKLTPEDLLVYDRISDITHEEAAWAISQLLDDIHAPGEAATDVALLAKEKYRVFKDSPDGRTLSSRMLLVAKHQQELNAYIGVRRSLQSIGAVVVLNDQDIAPSIYRGAE